MRTLRILFCSNLALILMTAVLAGHAQAQTRGSAQVLAPGVLKVIQPKVDPRDTHTLPLNLPDINPVAFEPRLSPVTSTLAERTRRITMFRDAWQYEFSFIPLRQIELDVAVGDGTTVRRNFWYLVYRIRNTGEALINEEIKHAKFATSEYEKITNFRDMSEERRQQSIAKLEQETLFGRYIGNFTLEGWVENISAGEYVKVSYRPVVDKNIIRAIQMEEDPATQLHSPIDMLKMQFPIVPADSDVGGVWGVAVWENVDPRIDFVRVYVSGLTNAYRLARDNNGELTTKRKTLQVNFWRPGDAVRETRNPVRYGIPLEDNYRRQIQICDRYNLPGPVLQGYEYDTETTRRRLIVEIDAEVSLRDLKSAAAGTLDGGTLPENLKKAFEDAGYPIPSDIRPKTNITGKQWSFETMIGGENVSFIIQLSPQLWEPDIQGGIRFINTLDYIWIYQ
ncbi:MAG TPA: hypothetical protein PKD64_05135 [Pirellulaceae bacterium]|nr:hypothetical protein [Pirellulaceae bacterium]HMO91560.1 hypothetical protein [Pirellulaceae bacterium]HMP68257.1 hypothetical protein [Pirellulaceae bacterium]